MPALHSRDLDHVLEHTGPDIWRALRAARLFVTGGTGFVGKWLVESLLWANDRLDLKLSAVLLTRDPERFCRESPHLASHSAVELWRGRVAEFDFPSGEFPFVIHAATERYFEPDERQPASTFDLDVGGTRRVLEFARTHGSQRLLFTSSGAVYGRQPPDLVQVGEDYPGAPPATDTTGAYGQAKRVSEFLCAMYASQFGLATVIARLFAFVGPYLPLDRHYAVGNFIRDALAGGPIRVKGDGTPYRSYLYAGDLAVWLWTLLIRGESARPYNVGSGQAITIADLARTVADTVAPGTPVVIAGKPVAGAQALRYVPSVERAKNELGLRARLSLSEGIRRTLDWERSGASIG
jgi:dTDP-glucose 4,6-dehydratase